VLKGQMTVRYTDGEEAIGAGEAFYLPPGHTPAAEAGTEFVQFSPLAELSAVMAVLQETAHSSHHEPDEGR
jgi:quercetin dioxygenase-like cupin family protein